MTHRWFPGDLFGRYRIDGVLGRGGMGDVYLAYDAQLRRKVALKVLLRKGEVTDTASSAKLLREARAAAAIEHPNAVQVFDVDEIDGLPFIAMELVEGKQLREYVKDPSVSLETKIDWLSAIARALHAAHVRGLVHRDVKPENVIIRNDGVVKVLDFGTARAVVDTPVKPPGFSPMASTAAEPQPAVVAATDQGLEGTLLYMAPEHVRGETLDAKADQWAWGVLAYELLSGAPPWDVTRGAVAVVSQIISTDPAPLSLPGIGDAATVLEGIIFRALSKSPADRFDSLAMVAESIDRRSSIEISHPRPASRWSRRFLAPVAAVLIAAGVGIVARERREQVTPAVADRAARPSRVGPPDYGSPMSTVPMALAEYQRAVQAARDAASPGTVKEGFKRAQVADPDFAAAYLRELLMMQYMEDYWRTAFTATQHRRDRLGPHDRALLDAIEPLFRVPHDADETRRRFAKLAMEEDADFDLQRCMFLLYLDVKTEAREACKDAQRLDPTLAAAQLGIALTFRGDDIAEAERAYRTCVARSNEASACWRGIAYAASSTGRCKEFATIAHHLVGSDSGDVNAHDTNVLAVFAEELQAGNDFSGFSVAMDTALAKHAPSERPLLRNLYDFARAVGEGRLDDALAKLQHEEALDGRADEDLMHGIYAGRLQLLLELGRSKEAIALSKKWRAERGAWVQSAQEDSVIYPTVALKSLGVLTRDQLAIDRDAWIESEKRRGATLPPALQWLDAYGTFIDSADDAQESLNAVARFSPFPPLGRDPVLDASLGQVNLELGHSQEAVTFLRAATLACPSPYDPVSYIQRQELFGRALAATGDRESACSVLRKVVDRWSIASGSRTARRAQGEIRKLGCEP